MQSSLHPGTRGYFAAHSTLTTLYLLSKKKPKRKLRCTHSPSSLPGETGLLGTVGERIFSSVEAIDGVIGVLGAEPTCKERKQFIQLQSVFSIIVVGQR